MLGIGKEEGKRDKTNQGCQSNEGQNMVVTGTPKLTAKIMGTSYR